MKLKDFKEYIEHFPPETIFDHDISDPFSWRGAYDEVAFAVILHLPNTREAILEKIEQAYKNTFIGYKGGEYTYNDHTPVHFESDICDYTDGTYCAEKIAKLAEEEMYTSQEMRLVNLAFQNK